MSFKSALVRSLINTVRVVSCRPARI